jgi:hypothetical protein
VTGTVAADEARRLRDVTTDPRWAEVARARPAALVIGERVVLVAAPGGPLADGVAADAVAGVQPAPHAGRNPLTREPRGTRKLIRPLPRYSTSRRWPIRETLKLQRTLLPCSLACQGYSIWMVMHSPACAGDRFPRQIKGTSPLSREAT